MQIDTQTLHSLLGLKQDVFKFPLRVGRKQGRAVLDANGINVCLFPVGKEAFAQEFCNQANMLHEIGKAGKHRRITTKNLAGCERCNKNMDLNEEIDPEFWGCPRGGCDVMIVGKITTDIILTFPEKQQTTEVTIDDIDTL